MPLFTYKARDVEGELVASTIEAKDDMTAAVRLRTLGYNVVSISIYKSGIKDRCIDLWQRIRKSHKTELVFLTRQLASLIKSGIPIVTAISSIQEQTGNKILRETLKSVSSDLESGSSFSEALAKHSEVFPELFVSMIKVGETGGVLDEVLERLSDLYEREYEFKARIKMAMTYPVILVVAAIGIVSFLLINTVPKFTAIFEAYDADLPMATQILVGMSLAVRKFWYIVAGLIAVGFFALRKYLKTEKGRYRFDSFLLKIPVFGEMSRKGIIANLTRTLGVMLKAGVAIIDALLVTQRVIGNARISRALGNIRLAIIEGEPLSAPFQASGAFPPMVNQMIALGEKSGDLEGMLLEVASFYDREVEYSIKKISTVLEPLLLLVMGVVVAFVALAILLPIFNMVKMFR